VYNGATAILKQDWCRQCNVFLKLLCIKAIVFQKLFIELVDLSDVLWQNTYKIERSLTVWILLPRASALKASEGTH